MQAIRTKYTRMPSNERNAMWISFVVMVVIGLMCVSVIEDLLVATTPLAITAASIPFVVLAITVTSTVLFWLGHARLGSIILMVGTSLGLSLTPFVAEGYALVTGLVSLAVLLAISGQLYPERFIAFTYIGSAVVAFNLLVDQFWPLERRPLDADVAVGQILSVALLIPIAILILRRIGGLRLQDKLILFAIAITLVPLFAVSIFTQTQTKQALVKSANESLLGSASQAAYTVDTFLNNTLENVRVDASLNAIVEYMRLPSEERKGSETEGHVKEILNVLSYRDTENIVSYALLDNQGYDVYDLNRDEIGLDFSKQDYFRVPMQTGQAYVSSVGIEEATGKSIIHFVAPIVGENGETVGLIRLRYDAGIVQQILQDSTSQLGANISTLIIDDKNIVIGNTKENSRLYQSIAPLTYSEWSLLVNQLRLPDKPFEESFYNLPQLIQAINNIEQTPYFMGEVHAGEISQEYAALARTNVQPWSIVASIDSKALLSPVETQARNSLLASIIAAVIAVVVAVFVSSVISAPINRLTSVAEKVAGGDLRARAWVETKDEIGTLATTFNSMTQQLQHTLEGLEQRVADRTRAIETSAVVGRRLSTVLDEQQLVKAVVDELQQSFDYYHVQMYLLEKDETTSEDGENRVLRLAGGTGEAGRQMIANGHKMHYGKGLIGRAAESGTVVFVPNTRSDPGWLPNPLLPETCAELAVPILIGDEVLGTLDIQHNVENALGQQDIDLLQSIAGQVAVTLRNARLYENARQQANRETLVASIVEQIQQTQSVEQALKVAAREIGRSVGGRPTLIRLYHSQPTNDVPPGQPADNRLDQHD